MSKIQAAQVIAKLPILPIQEQEVKMEKTEATKTVEAEFIPGTSTEQQWWNQPQERKMMSLKKKA